IDTTLGETKFKRAEKISEEEYTKHKNSVIAQTKNPKFEGLEYSTHDYFIFLGTTGMYLIADAANSKDGFINQNTTLPPSVNIQNTTYKLTQHNVDKYNYYSYNDVREEVITNLNYTFESGGYSLYLPDPKNKGKFIKTELTAVTSHKNTSIVYNGITYNYSPKVHGQSYYVYKATDEANGYITQKSETKSIVIDGTTNIVEYKNNTIESITTGGKKYKIESIGEQGQKTRYSLVATDGTTTNANEFIIKPEIKIVKNYYKTTDGINKLEPKDVFELTPGEIYKIKTDKIDTTKISLEKITKAQMDAEIKQNQDNVLKNKFIEDHFTSEYYTCPAGTQSKFVTNLAVKTITEGEDVSALIKTMSHSSKLVLSEKTNEAIHFIEQYSSEAAAAGNKRLANGITQDYYEKIKKGEVSQRELIDKLSMPINDSISSQIGIDYLPHVSFYQDGKMVTYFVVVVGTSDNSNVLKVGENKEITNLHFFTEEQVMVMIKDSNNKDKQEMRPRLVEAPRENIKAITIGNVKDGVVENNTTLAIQYNPRLEQGSTIRSIKSRFLALESSKSGNSVYSTGVKFNAYKSVFTAYSANSIYRDYGELTYERDKYYFYKETTAYESKIDLTMTTRLEGFFPEGRKIEISRTAPNKTDTAQIEKDTAQNRIHDAIAKINDNNKNNPEIRPLTYDYAYQAWTTNSPATNNYALNADSAWNTNNTLVKESFKKLNLLNDNPLIGTGTTKFGAYVVGVSTNDSKYYSEETQTKITVISNSETHGYNYYANYTRVKNFTISGTFFESASLGTGNDRLNAQNMVFEIENGTNYTVTSTDGSFEIKNLSINDVVKLNLKYTIAGEGTSAITGNYFFLGELVTLLDGDTDIGKKAGIHQLKIINEVNSVKLFGDKTGSGIIGTKFHQASNLKVNLVFPNGNQGITPNLPTGVSYELIKSITESIDNNGYVTTTLIISVLMPTDSTLLSYNVETDKELTEEDCKIQRKFSAFIDDGTGTGNKIKDTIYLEFNPMDGNPVFYKIQPNDYIDITKGITIVEGSEASNTNPIDPKFVKKIEYNGITYTLETISDTSVEAKVYQTGLSSGGTQINDTQKNGTSIYVTYNVSKSKLTNKNYYLSPLGEFANGEISWYFREVEKMSEDEKTLLTTSTLQGYQIENYNSPEQPPKTETEKEKDENILAMQSLLKGRLISNKYYLITPLIESTDARLEQSTVNAGSITTNELILTLPGTTTKYNGNFITRANSPLLPTSISFSYGTNQYKSKTITSAYQTFDAKTNLFEFLTEQAGANWANSGFNINAPLPASSNGYFVNLANVGEFGYGISSEGKVYSIKPYPDNDSKIDDISGYTRATAYIKDNISGETIIMSQNKNGTFSYKGETPEDKDVVYPKFAKNDPRLKIYYNYKIKSTVKGVVSYQNIQLANAYVYLPASNPLTDDNPATSLPEGNTANIAEQNIVFDTKISYIMTDANGNFIDAKGNPSTEAVVLDSVIEKSKVQTKVPVLLRTAKLKTDGTDIIVLGKYSSSGTNSKYYPSFNSKNIDDYNIQFLRNTDTYFDIDYTSTEALKSGFPGVKYLDGVPYPNPVMIFSVRHKVYEDSQITISFNIANVYSVELVNNMVNNGNDLIMDFSTYAFRDTEINQEFGKYIGSSTYLLQKTLDKGLVYVKSNVFSYETFDYMNIKITDIALRSKAGTKADTDIFYFVYLISLPSTNGNMYFNKGDVVKIRLIKEDGKIELKSEFKKQELETFVMWSSSKNEIIDATYMDIHSYYQTADGIIHFTSGTDTDPDGKPCYGLYGIKSGSLVGETPYYNFDEVVISGTTSSFRTQKYLRDRAGNYLRDENGNRIPTAMSNLSGYYKDTPLHIQPSLNATNNYFSIGEESVSFVASPFINFKTDNTLQGNGTQYRFKRWNVYQRYNSELIYRDYGYEGTTDFVNVQYNAIMTLSPDTAGKYIILPVYERVYSVSTSVMAENNTLMAENNTLSTKNPGTYDKDFTYNAGGTVGMQYDATTGRQVQFLSGMDKALLKHELYFVKYLSTSNSDGKIAYNYNYIQSQPYLIYDTDQTKFLSIKETTDLNIINIKNIISTKDEFGDLLVDFNIGGSYFTLDSVGRISALEKNYKIIELTRSNNDLCIDVEGTKIPISNEQKLLKIVSLNSATFTKETITNITEKVSYYHYTYSTNAKDKLNKNAQTDPGKTDPSKLEVVSSIPVIQEGNFMYAMLTVSGENNTTKLIKDLQPMAELFTRDFYYVDTERANNING
ncbi:MAG: hypothetical protein RR334_02890, partial [Clostridia bacterium]